MMKNKKGFTLIEMMVSVSIFVIVAFVVVSTLLTLSYAYKRAQKMRLLVDNFNFSLQNMSLDLREGVNYRFPCSDGSCLEFKSIDSWLDPASDNFTCYSLLGAEVKKCSGPASVLPCPCPAEAIDIISPDINVTKLKFELTGLGLKKAIKIVIKGTAGQGREQADLFIQNTVSQRNLDQ